MRESECAKFSITCGMGIAFKMGNRVWGDGAGFIKHFVSF